MENLDGFEVSGSGAELLWKYSSRGLRGLKKTLELGVSRLSAGI